MCRKEVILSGGVVGSPQLLLLSGVGPADHLEEVGVPLVHHLPGVGQNFQDHMATMGKYYFFDEQRRHLNHYYHRVHILL